MTIDDDIIKTEKFEIDKYGISIFNDGVNLRKIGNNEIYSIEFRKARTVKRRFLVTCIGIVISLFFLFLIIVNTTEERLSSIIYFQNTMLSYISLYVLFFLGVIIVIVANTKSLVMVIITKTQENISIPIQFMKKDSKKLIQFLEESTSVKVENYIYTKNNIKNK